MKINLINKIESLFEDSITTKQKCINQGLECISRMGDDITESIEQGNKILLCGNGGSAADAQHLAAEMLIRLRPKNNREGIAAIALAQDTSSITAVIEEVSCARAIAAIPSLLFFGRRRISISAAKCCASAADPPFPHNKILLPCSILSVMSSPILEMHSNP